MVEELSPEVTGILATRIARDGHVKTIYRVLANHPELLRPFCDFGDMLNRAGRLPARTRELAILRTSAHTGSAYEATYHHARSLRVGLLDDEITRLNEPGIEGLQPGDALVALVADELCDNDTVSPQTLEALETAGWTADLIVELILLVGFYRMIAGVVNSADVRPDPPTHYDA
jgi:4-carboxymuconolactone decarboxylase